MVVLALTLSLGAHWAFLQSAAWFSMVVTYSQDATFTEALEKTFDGEHPCRLCDFVQEGKKAEKQQEVVKVECEKKFFIESSFAIPDPPHDFMLIAATADSPRNRLHLPPTPPPRA